MMILGINTYAMTHISALLSTQASVSTASKNLFQFISLVLLLIFGFLSFKANARTLDEDTTLFVRHEKWMSNYGKIYNDSKEKALRFQIFKENVKYIEEFNNAGNKSYKLGVNQFADLTDEEYKSRNKFKGHIHSTIATTPTFKYKDVKNVPASLDWRLKGAVTPVKEQGPDCGCCWAFSAVAAMEGIIKLSTGKLISLSEQELVDCDTTDKGCRGGRADYAFKFITKNNGISSEDSYPYKGNDGMCMTQSNKGKAASIEGYEAVPANSESALLKAVANQPVSIAIDSGADFRFYSSGVFTGACGVNLDHAVTAVGYGVSEDGTKYWLMKNSWGEQWGEEGYIRIERDVGAPEGLCGIAMDACYPIA